LLGLLLVAIPAFARPTVKQRAIETVRHVAARDGFELRSAACWEYRSNPSSYLCHLCYVHPRERWGGSAVVWCDAGRCEWPLDTDDRRVEGVDWDRCFR